MFQNSPSWVDGMVAVVVAGIGAGGGMMTSGTSLSCPLPGPPGKEGSIFRGKVPLSKLRKFLEDMKIAPGAQSQNVTLPANPATTPGLAKKEGSFEVICH
jgi:hypothetical protein